MMLKIRECKTNHVSVFKTENNSRNGTNNNCWFKLLPPSLSHSLSLSLVFCRLLDVCRVQSQIKATGLYRRSVFAVADLYCAIIVMISIAEYYKIYNNIYTKYLK